MIRRQRAYPVFWMCAALAIFGPAFAANASAPISLNYASDHWRQSLTLYFPANACPTNALVIYLHAGGWLSGDKAEVEPHLPELLGRRFAVASINYRWSFQAAFPAQIHDCKGAIRYLRAHAAQYNIDPNRIAVFGDSSGGHLAALLATSAGVGSLEGTVGGNASQPSHVHAAATMAGPTDLFKLAEHPPHGNSDSIISQLFQWPIQDIIANMTNPNSPYPALVARVHSANPITHVSASDPPIHMVHGNADTLIPLSQSQLLHDAMLSAGLESSLTIVAGAGHELPASAYLPVFDFLGAALNNRLADVNCDGSVGVPDLLAVIAAWGNCNSCSADVTRDGSVGVPDLLIILGEWD